jgi:hypothetical protein
VGTGLQRLPTMQRVSATWGLRVRTPALRMTIGNSLETTIIGY